MLEKVPLKQIVEHAQELLRQDKIDAAMHVVDEVIGQYPENPYLLYLYATALMYKGEFGHAAAILTAVVKEHEDMFVAWNNLAVCHRREHNIRKSIEAAHKAIQIKADWPDPYNNLAGCYVNEGNPREGLKYADKAIELNAPGSVERAKSKWNKALMLLELGRYREGFDLYESGIDCGERPRRNYAENGETPYLKQIDDAKGKTVVVYGEQGMGDEIMFMACLQNLIDVAGTVILDCHPRLVSLFRRSFPGIEVHGTRKRQNITWPLDRQIDYCVSVGSMPRLYLQNNTDFSKYAYIQPERKIAGNMRRDLSDDRPIIGIAWSGGTKKTNNLYRSLFGEQLDRIIADPRYKFVSLEYNNDGHMPDNVEPVWPITQQYNYDLTACLIEACDAVVSINTTVVHLAGAMGKRVFCLTPSKPAWRYGVSGEEMTWYPDVIQYRQYGDDWTGAIDMMLAELEIWTSLTFKQGIMTC